MNSFPDFRTIVASFAPGWFASVMGTGVLAMTTRTLSLRWAWLAPAAEALHWFNIGLFLLIAVPWLLRWFQHTDKALATLRHPMQSPFYATLTVALLVMAAQTLNFGLGVELARAVWWCASLMTFGLNFLILFRLFTGEDAAMEHMTAAHFIPAVGLVVIPVAGIPLLNGVEGLAHDLAALPFECPAWQSGAASSRPRGPVLPALSKASAPCAASGQTHPYRVDTDGSAVLDSLQSYADCRRPRYERDACRHAHVGSFSLVVPHGHTAHLCGVAAWHAGLLAGMVELHLPAGSADHAFPETGQFRSALRR